MTEEEINELRGLVDRLICSSSKDDAIRPCRRLELSASMISDRISPYALHKLREVISYAKEASGQPRDKEHWVLCADSSWHAFEGLVFVQRA